MLPKWNSDLSPTSGHKFGFGISHSFGIKALYAMCAARQIEEALAIGPVPPDDAFSAM